MTTHRPATVDELHMFLPGEVARRNKVEKVILPDREGRAVQLFLDSVEACGLRIVREIATASSPAASAAMVEEPVAWQRFSERLGWTIVDAAYAKTLEAGGEIVRPLYALQSTPPDGIQGSEPIGWQP
jgi:hypothetical protein